MDISICFTKNGNINSAILRNDRLQSKYPELYSYIMAQYPEYADIRNKLLAIKNNGYCRCLVCDSIMEFPQYKNRSFYCSANCYYKSIEKKEKAKMGYQKSKSKREETNIKRFGGKSPFHSSEIQDKVKSTLQAKYGVSNVFLIPSIRSNALSQNASDKRKEAVRNNKIEYAKSLGVEIPNDIDIDTISFGHKSKPFDKDMVEIVLGLKAPTIEVIRRNCVHAYPYLHKYGLMDKCVSYPQQIIADYLTSLNVEFEQNNRSVISPKELDIYIPQNNLAIEINGVYWHDYFNDIPKYYHRDKTNECEEKGIQLLHFWDYEIIDKPDIVKSIIQSKLGLTKRIYARKCRLQSITPKIAKSFFEENHLQGHCNASMYYGLFYDNALVMCCSFGKSRFNANYQWELVRMATKQGYTVVGGFTKILSWFKQQNNGKIISYADRRISNGKGYVSSGFTLVNKTQPNYNYVHKATGELYSRQHFQKHKLVCVDEYDENKTELDIMRDTNQYHCIFDSGNLCLILE